MLKDKLDDIKNDMLEVRGNIKYMEASLKAKIAELERERMAEIIENYMLDVSEASKERLNARTNVIYQQKKIDAIFDEYEQWHNDQVYYLVYKNGDEVLICANQILDGTKPFPKLTDIVYAEMQSADDWIDTESGNLSELLGDCCDDGYDDRKFQYELAIALKYGTGWGRRYKANHPEFAPMAI